MSIDIDLPEGMDARKAELLKKREYYRLKRSDPEFVKAFREERRKSYKERAERDPSFLAKRRKLTKDYLDRHRGTEEFKEKTRIKNQKYWNNCMADPVKREKYLQRLMLLRTKYHNRRRDRKNVTDEGQCVEARKNRQQAAQGMGKDATEMRKQE